ncbi:MAG: hypothetical protein IPM21_10855 [Acidobacteria bacterium]|nr:hypothetical protein [Acidobacteriota bacterium]
MKVLIADEYGFCFGGRAGVEMVEESVQKGETVRTLGPLIHNEQEMKRLATEGVATISEPVQITRSETAVIRAHGVTPDVQKALESRPARSSMRPARLSPAFSGLASRAAAQDRHVVIVGSSDHPEMIGVKGYALTTLSLSKTRPRLLRCRGFAIRSSSHKRPSRQKHFSTPPRP